MAESYHWYQHYNHSRRSYTIVNRNEGTAPLTQIGLLALMAIVWTGVLSQKLILFTAHPILNSLGIILIFESALLLQPTHTAHQKQRGAVAHSILNGLAFLYFLAAFIVIFYNKAAHNGTHFESPHAILGITTYVILLIQALVGFTQYYTPSLYGGADNAKAIYKYHRISGYIVSMLLLATLVAATYTTFNINVIHISRIAIGFAAGFVLIGITAIF